MDKELLQRIALVQRDHWRALANQAGDYTGTQLAPGQTHSDGFQAETASPRDWAWFWNQYVEQSKSF